MARKSNKTAHVLGLLTKNKEDNTDLQPETSSNEKSAKITPTVDVISSVDTPISRSIKNKLLEEIGETPEPIETEQMPIENQEAELPSFAEAVDFEEESRHKNIAVADEITSQLESSLIIQPTTVSPKSQNKDNPDSNLLETSKKPPVVMDIQLADFGKELDYSYINVLEQIVREKVMEYLEKFQVCTCNRCIADTTALALTNLPSKYIVTDSGDVFPLLNYYSNKYATNVMTELTKACLTVNAFPHHTK